MKKIIFILALMLLVTAGCTNAESDQAELPSDKTETGSRKFEREEASFPLRTAEYTFEEESMIRRLVY